LWTDQQTGRQPVVAWPISSDDTTLVVMNADGSRGVAAEVAVIATVGWASALAIGMAVAGLVVVVIAIALLVMALRSGESAPAPAPPATMGP
jgi:hypothetical protein